MSSRYSLARSLSMMAFAALGFWFAQGAYAWPTTTTDPGAPPSSSPTNSAKLNRFGSTFIASFSDGGDTGFVPNALINCDDCRFPVSEVLPHTFHLTGRVLGRLVDDNTGMVIEGSAGVYDMNITITGVKATVSEPVPVDGEFSEQAITYTADLLGTGDFKAVLSGVFELDTGAIPIPSPLPAGTTISVGAEGGVTLDLVTTGPSLTFPALPASSPAALGQALAANVVFRVTETKRLRLPPVPD